MLALALTPINVLAVIVIIAAMTLVIVFNRQVARVSTYLSMRTSQRLASQRMLVARVVLVLWASTVITYTLLWLFGLVNPDA